MIVTVDFETYFDADYSLKKLSTSEYVRDKRFEALCASIKQGNKKPVVVWGHDAIGKALKKIDWTKHELLAHHTHFEGLILSHHYGIVPKKYRDTLSMGRALFAKSERNDLASIAERLGVDNKLGMPDFKGKRLADIDEPLRKAMTEYVTGDVESCAQSYEKMVERMPAMEMELIDITVRMFAEPVMRLNVALAKSEYDREKVERAALIAATDAARTAEALAAQGALTLPKPKKKGDPFTDERALSSNKVFPDLLRNVGIEPPMKTSRTTGKPTYALSKTDEEFTDLVAHPDQAVVTLVRGRLAAKSTIGETRAARLLRSGSNRKKLPVYLNYCGAHTTRWSGGDKLNYQNFKKKGDLRKAILAPPGQRLVVIDSSQIEARVLAWLAGEEWVLEAFREKRDLYVEFASVAYGKPVTKADKLERFVGKTCVLGLGFQMGAPKLQKTILNQSINQGLDPVRLDLSLCYTLVNAYRQKNRKIEALWEKMHTDVMPDLALFGEGEAGKWKAITWGKEYIGLPNGLELHYPDCRVQISKSNAGGLGRPSQVIRDASYKTIEGRTKLYGGLLTENVVQALARVVVAEQMLAIAERFRVVMMTHDEVVYLAPAKTADQALAWGLEVMHTPPVWAPDLPVAAEGGHDVCYSK